MHARSPEPHAPVTALEAMARRYARPMVFVGEVDRPPHLAPAPDREPREVPR
ncbi:MAG TPA: hypothetical protein VFY14_12765 [Streptomyces sp.]|nr:hypothetical protein [Streptomyces sp.]